MSTTLFSLTDRQRGSTTGHCRGRRSDRRRTHRGRRHKFPDGRRRVGERHDQRPSGSRFQRDGQLPAGSSQRPTIGMPGQWNQQPQRANCQPINSHRLRRRPLPEREITGSHDVRRQDHWWFLPLIVAVAGSACGTSDPSTAAPLRAVEARRSTSSNGQRFLTYAFPALSLGRNWTVTSVAVSRAASADRLAPPATAASCRPRRLPCCRQGLSLARRDSARRVLLLLDNRCCAAVNAWAP